MGEKTVNVTLAGNPNVGKSTLFNLLTGLRQHTGNWPGKTVGTARGRCLEGEREYIITDLPGTYSLAAASPEEEAASRYLSEHSGDVCAVLCDAMSLERGIILLLQIMERCEMVFLCVNLMDQAKKRGIKTDLPLLSKRLGIPVIGMVAHEKASRRLFLGAVDELYEHPRRSLLKVEENKAEQAHELCIGAVSGASCGEKADRFICSRLFGYPLMALLLALVFYISIVGANYPSQWLSTAFTWLEGQLTELFLLLSAPDWLRGLLIEGAFRTLSWVVAVMLPPMAIFFPLFSALEDLGYLPRVAYMLDGPFRRCSSCGKQGLTMCMGLGCNAAAVVGSRIIGSRRERLLAMLTNCLVPCNGRFPTLIALGGMFFAFGGGKVSSALLLTALVLVGVGMSFLMTKLLSLTVLKGEASAFILELPPYRRPRLGQILVRSLLDRTLFVLARAASVAAPAGALLWIMANMQLGGQSLLASMAHALEPLGSFIGLDGALLLAFILGFPANEIVLPIALMIYTGGSGLGELGELSALKGLLLQMGWTGETALCFMLFSLMHWPCSTTLLSIKKESGSWLWALAAALVPTVPGVLLCAVLSAIL